MKFAIVFWTFAGLIAGIQMAPHVAAQTPIPRAGKARLKISLNAYSFNKTLNDHLKNRGKGMSLFELLEFCAENDFDAIDPTGYYFPGYPKPPDAKFLNDFKRRAHQLGIDISGTGVRNNFASPDKAKRAAMSRTSRNGSKSPHAWARRCCASLPARDPMATRGTTSPRGWRPT